jgi:hypothetical protein
MEKNILLRLELDQAFRVMGYCALLGAATSGTIRFSDVSN